jgi:cell wall-associated NlpC family hydrolase
VQIRLQELDASAQRAQNLYDASSTRLHRLERTLRINRQALRIARANLVHAQAALARRLVVIYTTRDEQSTLAVLLGSHSIGDLVNRIETVQSVSKQDVEVMNQVIGFRHQISRRERLLERAHVLQAKLVNRRADAKQRAQAAVAREQHLYDSMKAEIAKLIAAQHARQLAAARLAQLRLGAFQDSQSQAYGATAVAGGTSVAPPTQYAGAVGIAMQYLGDPYVWGGSSPAGFDCSGFVAYVYAQLGVSLPHNSGAQWGYGVPVDRADLQPGDLVFFDGLGHVGIYVGGGAFIHAPHAGDVVKISSLGEAWYAATYNGARRITG